MRGRVGIIKQGVDFLHQSPCWISALIVLPFILVSDWNEEGQVQMDGSVFASFVLHTGGAAVVAVKKHDHFHPETL